MYNTSLERGDLPNCTFFIAPAKILGAGGASHHPAFMGNCRTISYMLYSPIYPVDEGNEDVGSV